MLDRGEVKSMAELARLGRRREVGRFDKVHGQIGGCPWPKLDLKGGDHTTGSLQTAADKESQKSAGLRDERSVNGSPV